MQIHNAAYYVLQSDLNSQIAWRVTPPHVTERSLRTPDPGSFPHTCESVWELVTNITSAPIYHTSFVQNATRNMQPATLHLPTTCTKLTKELHKNFVTRFFMKIHKFL